MASDRLVTPRHVLNAVLEHERRGGTAVLSELERREPDLVEYLLEGLTPLYHRLTELGLSGRESRRAYRLMEKTALVCLLAQRNAYRESWEPGPSSLQPSSDAGHLDNAPAPPSTPPPPPLPTTT